MKNNDKNTAKTIGDNIATNFDEGTDSIFKIALFMLFIPSIYFLGKLVVSAL